LNSLALVPVGQTRQLSQKAFHVTPELVDDIQVGLLKTKKERKKKR
jgi:hypothetical protein